MQPTPARVAGLRRRPASLMVGPLLPRLPQAKAQRGQYHELPEINGYFDDAQHYNDVK